MLHKQIGLALLHCNISAYIQFAKCLEVRERDEPQGRPFSFPLQFGFKCSPFTALCCKRDKREMPGKGPKYILLRVGKLSLSNPFVLYSNVLSILQGACDKHGVRCVRALDEQVLATLFVCYSGLSLDLGISNLTALILRTYLVGLSILQSLKILLFCRGKSKSQITKATKRMTKV